MADGFTPLPAVPEESQFETLVGTAMKTLLADIASGKQVGTDQIKAALADANKQVKAGG